MLLGCEVTHEMARTTVPSAFDKCWMAQHAQLFVLRPMLFLAPHIAVFYSRLTPLKLPYGTAHVCPSAEVTFRLGLIFFISGYLLSR